MEFALENTNQPIGVATYQVTRELPGTLRDEVPSIEDLEEIVANCVRKPKRVGKQLRRERSGELPASFAIGHCKTISNRMIDFRDSLLPIYRFIHLSV